VGSGVGPETDVAVDPIDGTTLTSVGQPNALSVIALAPRGSMFFPGAAMYMEKIATGPEAAEAIDIGAPVAENIRQVAKAKGKRPEEVTVTILDRPRHADMIAEIRAAGARVLLITDGDVAGAIVAAIPRTEVDLLMGIGGTPEGVVSAAALKCLGGAIQGKLYPRNDEERSSLLADGFDLDQVLDADTLAAGDDLFFAATGITDGYLLEGVRYWADGATTYSMVMRSRSGTIRYVKSDHRFEKLERLPALGGERVHAGGRLGEPPVRDRLPEGGEDRATHVRRFERVQIAGAQRPILDHRPVQRLAGVDEHPQHRLTRRHRSSSASANRSTCSGSAIVNGSVHGETMHSVTPRAANASARSRICSTEPLSVSARQESQVSSRIASPGNAARARSNVARASSSLAPAIP